MTCLRHKRNAAGELERADDAGSVCPIASGRRDASPNPVPFIVRLRGLRCMECRREQRAEQRMARGMAQMQADRLPDATLARMLDALGLPPLPGLSAEERALLKARLRSVLLLIGLILFVTTLAQPELIGRAVVEKRWFSGAAPDALANARLWLGAGLFWYMKPLFALLAPVVARSAQAQRAGLAASALGAACLWLLLPGASSGVWMGVLIVGIGAMLALASTLMGGLLVEQGQRMGATGRLGALHAGAIFLARLAGAGFVGIAATPTLNRVATGAAVLLAAFFVLYWQLTRKPNEEASAPLIGTTKGATETAQKTTDADMNGVNGAAAKVGSANGRAASASDLRVLLRSKPVWGVAGIAFLLYAAPNFTALQSQENMRLGFSAATQDGLDFMGAACGLLGVGGYLVLCRRAALQTLLRAGIVCNALGTLLYLGYASAPTAFFIEGANGLLSALVFAMLFDLAIRAIPRGQAMLGYAFLTSVFAFASHISNVFGSWLNMGLGWNFAQVVSLSAGLGVPALLVVAALPAALLDRREGKINVGMTAGKPVGAGVPLWGH